MRALVLMAALLAGCGDWNLPDGFTEADLELVRHMELTAEAVPDPTNLSAGSPAFAALGQALFFDTQISEPPGISCATCHDPKAWFIDTQSRPSNNVSVVQPMGLTDAGTPWEVRVTARNSASLVNVAHYRWWAWDGRSDSLWMQCGVAFEAKKTMAGRRDRIGQRMLTTYRGLADAAGIKDSGQVERDAANAYKAIAAYLTRLNSINAPFDRFVRGDTTALAQDQKNGLKLFLGKAGCIECHSGPAFNGNPSARTNADLYRSVAIAQRGPNVGALDIGRAEGVNVLLNRGGLGIFNTAGEFNDTPGFNRVLGLTVRPADMGLFRIKSLRQVSQTAPYMHAGQLATLEDVVHHYNVGGDPAGYSGERDRAVQPLFLTEEEERQLVRFLHALTGDPVPCALQCDTSATPDPKNLCSRCSP